MSVFVPENVPAFPFRVNPGMNEANPIRFGRLTDEDIEAYHKAPVLSKTKIDVFRQSARLFQGRYITREFDRDEDSDALRMGSAVDALALDDEAKGEAEFARRFAIIPSDAPRRPTKKQRAMVKLTPAAVKSITFWDAFDAANKGKTALTQEEADTARMLAKKVNANETFAALKRGCLTQVTYRMRGDKFAVQVRPDLINETGKDGPEELTRGLPYIVDLKTIRALPQDEPDFLPRHVAEFGYHRGAYMYPELVSLVNRWGDFRPQFILAFQETQEPYATIIKPVDGISTEIGEVEVREAMMRMETCIQTGVWPETWEEPMTPVSLPSYYVRRALETSNVRTVF